MSEILHSTHEAEQSIVNQNITSIANPISYNTQAAASVYNASTVSSIVFGIFMALLTLFMIWQNSHYVNSKTYAHSCH